MEGQAIKNFSPLRHITHPSKPRLANYRWGKTERSYRRTCDINHYRPTVV